MTQGWHLLRLGLALLFLRLFGERDPEKRRVAAIRRTVATLGELKGAFVKAGQFAAVRLDLVPPEAQPLLASLRDRVPARPLAEVRAVVEAELGGRLEDHFAAFAPEPLGAASIGQVHRARLHDGTPVAVKVQYPWLSRSLRADLAWLRFGLRRLGRRGGRFDAERLFEEFSRGMAEELDFEREADSARAIAANLAGDAQIVVPDVHPALSTRRVLTMTYHPCVPVTDAAGLARLGVAGADVVAIVARAYAKQVFVDGRFHADPHPGNLFVLDEPEAARRPRVLFVDFGLSRTLDPTLRAEIRKAMYALMQRDASAFVAGMERMDMIAPGAAPGVVAAVDEMFERLSGVDAPLGLGGAQVLSLKDQAKALLQDTPGVQLPNDLLLYARTMAYVFGLGQELAPEADVMKLCVPPLLQFLAEGGDGSKP
ncbi:MAG: AarF/ABC1/UbiB kinase family protein [Myxococcales bacterium]|nr:AarF/ABC1/UbiB kinase family protein [Myxococcales bacterium]